MNTPEGALAPMRLAVLGDPLRFTRSPELHRAGLASLGLACVSEALRTPVADLGARLEALAAAGCRGANLTHPLKEAVLSHLDEVSEVARRARSVNTVTFEGGRVFGDTTDGAGFLDLLDALGLADASDRVVMLGAGGAARSLALALGDARAITVVARDPDRARTAWRELPGVPVVGWDSAAAREAMAGATLVVHATPLAGSALPVDPGAMSAGAALIDLVYAESPTPLVRAARAAHRRAWDGLGLLVHQARRSLERWTGRPVPLEPLARAVGWPR